VCASEPSGNRGLGRVLSLEKNFYRLPFTPPSLVAYSVLQRRRSDAPVAGSLPTQLDVAAADRCQGLVQGYAMRFNHVQT
jgi:hypothetical protein